MKISLDWISQYVDLAGLTPEQIALKLTMGAAEVEGIERIRRFVDGVLVGQLLSAEPLTGHEELSLVTVDCGTHTFTTVCSAPNVRVGLKSAFAPAGTTIAGGQRIERSSLAGRDSQGILCSARELGLSEYHEIILEVPAAVPNGSPLSELIPAEDVLLEVDNKSLSHRPDLWGHYGFAREFAALLGRPLKPMHLANLEKFDGLPAYPVAIDDLRGCPAYGCIEMETPANQPSPLFMQRRLHALGQRTFNLLVDLTNYIMFELAQPMHAFDGSYLKAVRVAPMARHGTFVTLDRQERDILPDDLMIWNEREPVALAGVMGGLYSEVGSRTTRLLLESANFRGSRIRRTSTRLGLRTEASLRFEKNQPPVNCRTAVARFLALLDEAGVPAHVLSRFSHAGDLKDSFRSLAMPLSRFHATVGMEIPPEIACDILRSIGFAAQLAGETLQVGIPPHRSAADISIPEDIVEEVARIYGYDNIVPQMPLIAMDRTRFNEGLRAEHKARRLLAQAHRFTEVHSYSWFDDLWLKSIGFDPGPTLTLRNPSAEHLGRMRTTLMPNLLSLVPANVLHRDRFRLFELGRVYLPQGETDRTEQLHLAGASCQQARGADLEEHYRSVRGALEDLALALDCGPFSFVPADRNEAPWQTAMSWAEILVSDRRIGAVGCAAEPLLSKLALNAQVVWFELRLDGIGGRAFPALTYDPPSRYPGSWADFSIVWDLGRGFAALDETLARFSSPLVVRREFLYLYKGKGLPEGKGSYTFRYFLGSPERTLTGDEIEQFRAGLLAFLKDNGLELR